MEEIKMIAGKFNNGEVRYWRVPDELSSLCLGEYAIIENLNGYDLVKIVGLLLTNKEEYHNFIGNNRLKNVVKVVNLLEE